MRTAKEEEPVASEAIFLSDFTRFYILLLLFEGAKHGYEIMHEMLLRLKQKASPSLVYPFLKELENANLVKAVEESTGDRKRTKYYLSPKGRSLCLRTFSQFTSIVTSAIEPSLKICRHCGCKIFDNAYETKISGVTHYFCCKYCAASFPK